MGIVSTSLASAPDGLLNAAFAGVNVLIDVQPNEVPTAAANGPQLEDSQCASCNFVPFISGLRASETAFGILPIARFFARLPEILQGLRQRPSVRLQDLAAELGCRHVARITSIAPTSPIDTIYRWREDAALLTPDQGFTAVLLEPGASGPEILEQRVDACERAGYRRIILGYSEHGTALERWPEFCEIPEFAERWQRLLQHLARSSHHTTLLMFAYPPCALLQWKANAPLERTRARIDLQFRRLQGDRSLMCPENVSGYSLFNDVRELLGHRGLPPQRLIIRCDDALFWF